MVIRCQVSLFKFEWCGTLLDKQGGTHKWCSTMDPWHGQASVGRPARTYLQQLWTDTGCSLEGRPETIDDRNKWREIVR